ncbi:ABC transporter ATP-binding protein [Pseudomonas nitroreducens]|uniref:ABC transporter ATP-binding protein n=1 Tax=Pseudomonas nitroreducens TaxID=46680 RepID=A0A6G6J4N6_PSENT|nr:ABC transporter ATP-binding protein [Pseudomonas nitroreducens]MBG6290913.1 ABC transporter ATP-binding protein [Pseudomonas nitroreducens]NMZ60754.1 ABC transporter ATP-binding protein [Pseudomonas nitroreducens]QIE90345.1 ABC transporter ATP-binding protein [Pseudomonas nitroreducens]SNT44419.1 lipopolysaccharide transport system ATP-binding protein [Pseudomonas nitroreducens]
MYSSDIAIRVSGISKCFTIYNKPQDRLKQALAPRLQRLLGRPAHNYGREFWALRDINFEVARGETVGIVGRNGSGKSTLLQIICGTLMPTAGKVETFGRVAALLELGSGFNPEFSGRENVYLNASVLGLSREEVDERFDSIAAFADIGDFIDQPVKTYSSGMAVRLAFAVQAQIDPEILIVDEALSVGDARFQVKCFERLRQLKDNGTSILLVSHSSEQIVTHCSRAILLDSSHVHMLGAPRKVMNRYMDLLFGREKRAETKPRNASSLSEDSNGDSNGNMLSSELSLEQDIYSTRQHYNPHEYRWGDGAATILDFDLRADGKPFSHSAESGAVVTLDVSIRFNHLVVNPILGFNMKTTEGVTVFGTNSYLQECSQFQAQGEEGTVVTAKLQFKNRLTSGNYFISLGIASRQNEEIVPHDRRYDSIHLVVAPTNNIYGLVDLGLTMEIDKEAADVLA